MPMPRLWHRRCAARVGSSSSRPTRSTRVQPIAPSARLSDVTSVLPPPDAGLVQLMADVNLFAQYAQEAAMRVLPVGLAPPLPVKRLSPREREVLQWSAMGKTAWEVSQIVGISESTVDFHVRNAMTKLGASNKNAAVARAPSLGLL